LGLSLRKGLVSQLERLFLHLLKWRHDLAQDPRRLWHLSILDARHEISQDLAMSPSLQGFPAERLADAYRYARRVVAIETDLPQATFPETCPWTIEQVLDDAFLPEG
jgi:hypothetical protein